MKLLTPAGYQDVARKVFQSVRAEVLRVLPLATVEHVGSSAIPGALSKGDVDICVVVGAGLVPDAARLLKPLGYIEQEDTLQTQQLCMLLSERKDIDLALQVVEAGSQFEFFVLFRDALLANPVLVDEYNSVKQAAAHPGPVNPNAITATAVRKAQDAAYRAQCT